MLPENSKADSSLHYIVMAAILPNKVTLLSSNMADTTKVLLYVPQSPQPESRIRQVRYRCMVIYALMSEEVEVAMNTKQVRISIDG